MRKLSNIFVGLLFTVNAFYALSLGSIGPAILCMAIAAFAIEKRGPHSFNSTSKGQKSLYPGPR